MKMFERAFARADVDICFSQGFNPHPRMSLPLPRPVGVESGDEILVAKIDYDQSVSDQEYKLRLGTEMPQGCQIKELEFFDQSISPAAEALIYHFPISGDFIKQVEKQ